MTRCVFAIPGDLATPTGGYTYARKILPFLADRMDVQVCALPPGFPFPSEAELNETATILGAVDRTGSVLFADGLAYGALPQGLIKTISSPIVALVHHPLCLEEGLSPQAKAQLLKSEGEALRFARHAIVPSSATASALAELFGIGPAKITIAEPGVLSGKRADGAPDSEPLHIVSVGAVTPRKGFDVLVSALHKVRDLHWRATIAGAHDRSPETSAAIRDKVAHLGLADRVRFAGSLDESAISALYSSGDIFVLASFYEGYGMAFAEAMAHGLPIVASGDGAVRDTVPEEAGFICAPGDVFAIAGALRSMLLQPVLRREKAQAAWERGQKLPTWKETGATIAGVLQSEAR